MRLVCLTDRSVPLPGESWLWTGYDGFRVAVDVGARAADFGLTVAAHEPHVLILSHDDDDHIGGIADFLGAMQAKPSRPWPWHSALGSGLRPLQIWMPFDWVRLALVLAVTQGLLDPDDFDIDNYYGADHRRRRQQRNPEVDWITADINTALSQALDDAQRRGSTKGKDGRTRKIGGTTDAEVIRNRSILGSAGHDRDLADQRLHDLRRRRDDDVLRDPLLLADLSRHEADSEHEHDQYMEEMDRLSGLVEAIAGLGTLENVLIDAVTVAVSKGRRKFGDLFKEGRGWTGTDEGIAKRAVKTADRTLSILRDGLRAGAILRFFDPDAAVAVARAFPNTSPPWHTQGKPGRVTILNAGEVRVRVPHIEDRRHAKEDALALAALLTVQNSRALATYLWPEPGLTWYGGCGAIIWSDTEHRIAGEPPTHRVVPWFATSVMSAPHHASDDQFHADLWRHKANHVRVLLSHNRERDTNRFLSLPPSQRDCTKCAAQSPAHAVTHLSGDPSSFTLNAGRCLESHDFDEKRPGGRVARG